MTVPTNKKLRSNLLTNRTADIVDNVNLINNNTNQTCQYNNSYHRQIYLMCQSIFFIKMLKSAVLLII